MTVKLQTIEHSALTALMRSGMTRALAQRLALSIVREAASARSDEVQALAARGLSVREIAEQTGMSKSTVHRLLSHRRATDGTDPRPTIGPRIDRQDATP